MTREDTATPARALQEVVDTGSVLAYIFVAYDATKGTERHMTKLAPFLDNEDATIRGLLAEILPRRQRKKIASTLGITLHQLNSFCARPSAGKAETIAAAREGKTVWKLRRKPYLQARLINPLSDLTGDDRLRLHFMGSRFRKLVKFAEAELEARRHARELLRRKKARAKAKSKPKKGGPFLVAGTTTR